MTIKFPCRTCSQRYEVDGSMAGRGFKCKKCGASLTVPVPRQSSAQAPTLPQPSTPRARPTPRPEPVTAPQIDLGDAVEAQAARPPARGVRAGRDDIYDFGDTAAGTPWNDADDLDDELVPASAALYDPADLDPEFVLSRGKGNGKARAEAAEGPGFFAEYGRVCGNVAVYLGAALLVLAALVANLSLLARVAFAGTAVLVLIIGRFAMLDRSPAAQKARERARREKERARARRREESSGLRQAGRTMLYFGLGGLILPVMGLQFTVLAIFGPVSQVVAVFLFVPGILITVGTWDATGPMRPLKYAAFVGSLLLSVFLAGAALIVSLALLGAIDPTGAPPNVNAPQRHRPPRFNPIPQPMPPPRIVTDPPALPPPILLPPPPPPPPPLPPMPRFQPPPIPNFPRPGGRFQ